MNKPCDKPCPECPWSKTSAPGWLGTSTPIEFLQQSEAGIHMPCHLHVDYERPDWQKQANRAPACRGRLIHFANRSKRVPGLPSVERDDGFFTNPQEFIDHHSRGQGPQILIIGTRVMEMHP